MHLRPGLGVQSWMPTATITPEVLRPVPVPWAVMGILFYFPGRPDSIKQRSCAIWSGVENDSNEHGTELSTWGSRPAPWRRVRRTMRPLRPSQMCVLDFPTPRPRFPSLSPTPARPEIPSLKSAPNLQCEACHVHEHVLFFFLAMHPDWLYNAGSSCC